MKKTFLMCVALLATGAIAKADFDGWAATQQTNADVFDTWSAAGHAWSTGYQPYYGEHILLANGDRERLLTEQAQLDATVSSSILDPHMLGHVFYTGYLTPASFVITPSAVSTTGRFIMMGIVYTGNTAPDPMLHYGSQSLEGTMTQTVNLGESIVVEDPDEPLGDTQFRVYTWDVGSYDVPETFTISFNFPRHVAFSNIVISQVPEPASAALLFGTLGAGALWVARRRRNRCQ